MVTDVNVAERVAAALTEAGFNEMHSCGHPIGDHAAWRNRETWGFPCYVDGCDCEGTDLD